MNDLIHEGIIVKTINYKETSKMVFIVTKNGLESIEVKGANKINGHSHLYANLLSKISYTESKHFFQSGKVIDNYISIRNNVNKLEDALGILELSYALVEHITDFNTFYLFLDSILDLINNSDNYHIYTLCFFIKVTYLLGIAPSFNKCVSCGTRKNLAGFVFTLGGMKCKDCLRLGDVIYDNEVINIVSKMYYTKLDNYQTIVDEYKDKDLSKVKYFIDDYLEEYIGYKSKSDQVFLKLSKI